MGLNPYICRVKDCIYSAKCFNDVRLHQFTHYHGKFFQFSTCDQHPKDCRLYKSWRTFEKYQSNFVQDCPTCQYQCSFCNQKFKVVNLLVNHAAQNHLPDFGIERVGKKKISRPKQSSGLNRMQLNCPKLPGRLAKLPGYNIQKKSKFINILIIIIVTILFIVQYCCKISSCLSKFNTICLLRSHQLKDHHRQFFKCSKCPNLSLDHVNQLTDHIQKDHPNVDKSQRLFKCAMCSQTFSCSDEIKYHVWNVNCENIKKPKVVKTDDFHPPSTSSGLTSHGKIV